MAHPEGVNPLASPLAVARRRAAGQLHGRVAGPNGRDRAERIWRTPGPRWFTPEDPVWRVHADASMFGAGVRALLLQSLHPLAMAGVADHSDYREDPWGRLQRTSAFISTTTFGTIEDAERLIAKVRGIHRRVHGVAQDGRPYRADDPRLLMWVHCAEAESFLTMHQRYGAAPLTDAQADTYVAQIGSISAHLGLPDPPQTVRDLHQVLADFRPELMVTPAALEAAKFVVHEPPLSRSARPAYALLVDGAVATLPPYARSMLGMNGSTTRIATRDRLGGAGTRLIRWVLTDPSLVAERTPVGHADEPRAADQGAGS
ncbi:oxygenase MpaB family protein [Demetria terragena]|uniref:oxygenase MpaB family protein n=1 Tax=Demetria terragena TaxID=63959 RepID=UPI000685D41A|nr:oxygenase MpaB family protein [Demetria terragena]